MSHFQWNADQAIHLPEVDAEHRALYLLAEDLRRSVLAGAEVTGKLRALVAEIEDHFSHEERLMRKVHYAMLDWHKGQHDTVRRQARRAARRFQKGEGNAVPEFLEFMARWLQDHLAVADNMMGAAVRNHQRSHAA